MVEAAVVAVDAHGAMQDALVAQARGLAEQVVGKPLRLRPEQVRIASDWAFVSAQIEDLHGRPIDYEGTRFQEDAREGGVSKRYVALLRRDGQGWRAIEQLVGPTGVAWADWPAKHGAPAALFSPGR